MDTQQYSTATTLPMRLTLLERRRKDAQRAWEQPNAKFRTSHFRDVPFEELVRLFSDKELSLGEMAKRFSTNVRFLLRVYDLYLRDSYGPLPKKTCGQEVLMLESIQHEAVRYISLHAVRHGMIVAGEMNAHMRFKTSVLIIAGLRCAVYTIRGYHRQDRYGPYFGAITPTFARVQYTSFVLAYMGIPTEKPCCYVLPSTLFYTKDGERISAERFYMFVRDIPPHLKRDTERSAHVAWRSHADAWHLIKNHSAL